MSENQTTHSAHVIKLTCSSDDQREDFEVPCRQITLVADGDCFVNFNKPVTTLGRFLLKANVPVTLDMSVSKLHYLSASATPAIYVVASR